jgi:hypothetical protein
MREAHETVKSWGLILTTVAKARLRVTLIAAPKRIL